MFSLKEWTESIVHILHDPCEYVEKKNTVFNLIRSRISYKFIFCLFHLCSCYIERRQNSWTFAYETPLTRSFQSNFISFLRSALTEAGQLPLLPHLPFYLIIITITRVDLIWLSLTDGQELLCWLLCLSVCLPSYPICRYMRVRC